jgi:hypothetical protein
MEVQSNNAARMSKENLSRRNGSPHPTVDDFVAVKAFSFNKSQQLSTNGSQQVQYQSLRTTKFRSVQ